MCAQQRVQASAEDRKQVAGLREAGAEDHKQSKCLRDAGAEGDKHVTGLRDTNIGWCYPRQCQHCWGCAADIGLVFWLGKLWNADRSKRASQPKCFCIPSKSGNVYINVFTAMGASLCGGS